MDRTINECSNINRHKYLVIDPSFLIENKISVCWVEQHPNQFIVTSPRAYHSGYNAGINYAEAINYATPRGIKYGENYDDSTEKPCYYCDNKIKDTMKFIK